MFVTVYQINPVFSTSYYSSSTKAVQHFCRTALRFRLYLNRLHTRDILLQPQKIRFIEMPRHGNVQLDFTELPSCRLRSISRTVIFLCSSQSYRRTRSPLPSVRPPAPRKPIPAAMLAATRETSTETPAAPTIGRKPYEETSVISAAPSETIMYTRIGAFHACLPLHTDQQTADSRNDQPHQTDHLNIFRRTQAPSE